MKIWIDDVRPAPDGYVWLRSVDEAKECIVYAENQWTRKTEVFMIVARLKLS